jgi:crotonobetainyl-CoA:carnitine CoA-transferase CaiB-like acyl-CoA transferase
MPTSRDRSTPVTPGTRPQSAALDGVLVLASARAYGRHPAAEGLRGMDVTVQAVSGMVSSTGFPDGPPVKAGGAVVDFATGTHLAAAVLAALFQRERTGQGQHVEVDEAVTAWTTGLDKDSAFRLLQQADIPAAPVRSLREVLHDPVLRDRGMLAEIGEGPRACTVLGSPIHLADSAQPQAWSAPLLGEHTLEVLRGRLNLNGEEIERLAADGLI